MPACMSIQLGDCWRCYTVYAAEHLLRFLMLHLFNSVSCVTHLIGPIKSRIANSEAGETGGAALRDDEQEEGEENVRPVTQLHGKKGLHGGKRPEAGDRWDNLRQVD